MSRLKYPLEALREVRKTKVDVAARELQDRRNETQAEEERCATAERRLREHLAEEARVRSDEAARLADGNVIARDLDQAGAWEAAARLERLSRQQALTKTEQSRNAARTSEKEAERLLAGARGDAEVQERHKDSWDAAERGREVAKQEEEMAEVWGARKR